MIHLPGLLGLGAAYTTRLVLEFGVFRGRPGFSLVWPTRVALVVGLSADAGLIWAVLTTFYL